VAQFQMFIIHMAGSINQMNNFGIRSKGLEHTETKVCKKCIWRF